MLPFNLSTMKSTSLLAVILLIFLHLTTFSQPCLPQGILFTTQSQIDDFQSNYPDCTEIEGWVIIFDGYGSEYITDLSGLSVLTSIGGDFIIEANDSLTNLTGLEGLASIGGSFKILHNNSLTDLIALENLSSIGGDLWISYNSALTSLSGLDHITPGSINSLKIIYNSSLSACEVESICYFVASPAGEVQISDNATGCNSMEEVNEACDEIFCLIAGIQFHSQASIDDFQINHPNCTEILGYVRINGPDITNLNGLSAVTSIGGDLEIYGNDLLISLSGLEGVTCVGEDVSIGEWLPAGGNRRLKNLTGLNGLGHIKDLRIINNDSLINVTGLNNLNSISGHLYIESHLTSLTGLENLDTIGGWLNIRNAGITSLEGLDNLVFLGGLAAVHTKLINLTGMYSLNHIGSIYLGSDGHYQPGGNEDLTNLSGLENISSVEGSVGFIYNPVLTNLDGLENVVSMDGAITIHYNNSLNDLSGLGNIAAGSIEELSVYGNSSLSNCDVESICNYLASPAGSVEIYDNAPGCNNPDEVEEACGGTSADQPIPDAGFTFYPNPPSGQIIFHFTLNNPSRIAVDVLNSMGLVVAVFNQSFQQGKQQIILDVSHLQTGLYFCRLSSTVNFRPSVGRFVVVN